MTLRKVQVHEAIKGKFHFGKGIGIYVYQSISQRFLPPDKGLVRSNMSMCFF